MSGRALAALLCLCVLALAAAAPLDVPYVPPNYTGSAALWQGRGEPSFIIHTRSDPATRTGTVLRNLFTPGAAWRGSTEWDAAKLLDATAPAERRIYTLHGERTIPFQWADMPAALREVFDADGGGEARIAALRAQALGAILRSTPLIVGAPVPRAFPERYAKRALAVYVGANDGMLHAFSATTGKESFAYIPRLLQAALPALLAPDSRPRAWVDGSAGARDVRIGEDWRTVLASGLGMGARGLFLLDVTDPEGFGRDTGALWEFGSDDDDAIGHIHKPPAFAQLPRASTRSAWTGRQVTIVSSGINPQKDSAAGALFLLALDKAAGEPWQRDVNYIRIDTTSSANILSPPALVIGADGTATHAYAGDLDGNLWHFDLSTMRSRLVFTARDGSGRAQSIAHAPQVIHAPGGGYMVVFGTGKLLEADDVLPAAFRHQSLYGIHDVPGRALAAIRSRRELAERILDGVGSYTISGDALDFFLPDAKRGWFFDLPNSSTEGERAADSPIAESGVLVFQTVAPCAAAGETMRHYYINAIDGMAVDPLASAKRDKRTGAISKADPLLPLIFIRGAATESVRSPTGSVVVTRLIQLLPTGAGESAPEIPVRHEAGRLGWREISNWQDLHAAARRRGG